MLPHFIVKGGTEACREAAFLENSENAVQVE